MMHAAIVILAVAGVPGAIWADPPAAPTAPPLRNYVAEWAAEVEAIPESDRAWPLYKEADASLKRLQEFLPGDVAYQHVCPGHEHWPTLVRWLEANQAALELAKTGSRLPLVGMPVMFDADGDGLPDAANEQVPRSLVGISLPHLGTTRQLSRLLCVEMLTAAETGDADRWLAATEAALGIPPQVLAEKPVISRLVGFATLLVTLDRIMWTLDRHPDLLKEPRLARVANALDALKEGGVVRLEPLHERMFMDDLIQHVFEPEVGGRVSKEGGRLLAELAGGDEVSRGDDANQVDEASDAAMHLVLVNSVGTRGENAQMADRVWGAYQRDWARPLWDSDLSESHKLEAEIDAAGWKYLPIGILLVTHNAYWAQEQTRIALDGCRITVALARHRLKHGSYPQTLEALVPEFLAQMPIDRYSGKPFLYKLTDGKPLLYAAGVDQDDDGGEPMTPNNSPWPGDGWENMPPAERPSGDWVIWPPRRS